jgi:hypothetical protein
VHHSRAADDGIRALRTYQDLFQGGTFRRLDVIGTDVSHLRSEQTASLAVVRDMVDCVHQTYVNTTGFTTLSLNTIDARLNAMQEQLQSSINQTRSLQYTRLVRILLEKPP